MRSITYRIFQAIRLIVVLSTLGFAGCNKVLEVDQPIDKITADKVYNKVSTAISAMSGVYANLANSSLFTSGEGLSNVGGLLSDELVSQQAAYQQVYLNTENVANGTSNIWRSSYGKIIYSVNSVIEGVSASENIPESIKNTLIGEAKFTRALIYFYLVNLYGDVPLVLTTDFRTNGNISRTASEQVYEQIIKDLKDADAALPDSYLGIDLTSSTDERIRPNKSAAKALLSRVYLYTGQWLLADETATSVINNSAAYRLVALDSVFLKNNQEAIWQLQPDLKSDPMQVNTPDGRLFIPYEDISTGYFLFIRIQISNFLLSRFESGDGRRTSWIKDYPTGNLTSTIPGVYKYKVGGNLNNPEISQEYTMVLRLGELYLIRAEARAQQGNINGALEDINLIRARASLPDTTAASLTEIFDRIETERATELFAEMGHRWLDLKRWNKINDRMSVVTPVKGGEWLPFKALLPIPYNEFKYNPALVGHQNPGYREVE